MLYKSRFRISLRKMGDDVVSVEILGQGNVSTRLEANTLMVS